MIHIDIKRRAFAAMDHVLTFELHLSTTSPEGEHVVQLVRGPSAEAVKPTARFLRHMALTFFPDKYQGRASHVEGPGTAALYLVGTLPTLGDDDIEPIDDHRSPEAPPERELRPA